MIPLLTGKPGQGLSLLKRADEMPRYQQAPYKGAPKCEKCGFRIRGKLADHNAGEHHKASRLRPRKAKVGRRN